MDLNQLRLLGSGLAAPTSSFGGIAIACHDLTEVELDVRFHVLEDCCRLLEAAFGVTNEDLPVSSGFYGGANDLLTSHRRPGSAGPSGSAGPGGGAPIGGCDTPRSRWRSARARISRRCRSAWATAR